MKLLKRLRRWLSDAEFQSARLLVATALLALVTGYAFATFLAWVGWAEGTGLAGLDAARLRADNRRLTRELARLETDIQVDREAYAGVERQLGKLQEKVLEQQEEVAFYRGVVVGTGNGGLKVSDFALRSQPDGTASLSFVITQVGASGGEVAGQVQLRIEGERGDRMVSIDGSSLLGAEERRKLAFRFRYFAEIATVLAVPDDFKPQRVVIRVVPSTRGLRDSIASFPWSAEPA
ncbi:MAG: hypothetical protein FJ197_06500 [Gammaproteobacteria bacterium]|nr:hypothetical protein [Gammaproteobacteria bacterium]